MKPKVVKCEFCEAEISSEPCKLANFKTVINGKEHIFCCATCAQESKNGKKNGK